MLRVMDDNRPLNRPSPWARAALLGLTAIAASAVRGPAQAPEAKETVQADNVPPFDVSHVPARANLLFAIRPAAVLAQPGMRPVAERFNGPVSDLLKELAFPSDRRMFPQDIEQIVIALAGAPTPPQPGQPAEPDGPRQFIMQYSVLIRMTHDFDWPGVIRAGAAAAKVEEREVRPGLFRVSGTDRAYYLQVVDRRTMCALEGPYLSITDSTDQLLERSKPAADPAAAWGPAWAKARRAAAVVALDNRTSFWTDMAGLSELGPNMLNAIGRPSQIVACLDLAENVTAHVHMTADERFPGQRRANLDALAVQLLAGVKGNPAPGAVITSSLLTGRSITRDGTTDSAELCLAENGVPVKLSTLLLGLELPHTTREHAP
jgi:hypothetical protein